MEKRQLGNSGVDLSALGFGCASVWGKSFFEEKDAMELFFTAYEKGITFFDTGYSYGLAEERLGKCLGQLGSAERGKLRISTKCGTRISDSGKYYHDWNPDWMKQSLHTSLERLGTDYVDLLHLHGPGIEDMSDAVLYFLDDMKKQGLVRAVGVNSFDTDVLEHICKNKLLDFVMVDYNIMRQDREDLISRLTQNGIGVIAGAPLAESLFSNRVFKIKGKKDIWYLLRALKNFRSHLFKGFDYRFINKESQATGNQIALRYVLDNPNVTAAVFGTTNPEHLCENIGALDITIPNEIKKKIIEVGRAGSGKKLDRV